MVKREVYERIRSGKKTVELRKGKAKSGDQAVFQCGRSILSVKLIRRGSAISQIQDVGLP
jgi:ASC-1-like (ASCH) protein